VAGRCIMVRRPEAASRPGMDGERSQPRSIGFPAAGSRPRGQHGRQAGDSSRPSSPVALRAIAPTAEHLVAAGRLASGLFRQRIDVVQLQRAALASRVATAPGVGVCAVTTLCAPGMGMDGLPSNTLMYPAVASRRSLAVLRTTAPFTQSATLDTCE
jgi:hypothetical protein